MSDRPSRGLLDTSVVIDLDAIDSTRLPTETAISAVTLAELAAGPHATDDEQERRERAEKERWKLDRERRMLLEQSLQEEQRLHLYMSMRMSL